MSTELMKAFDFNEEDLEYNKAGKLSPRQYKKFKNASNRGRIFALVVMLASGIGAYFTLSPFLLNGLAVAGNIGRLIGGIALAGVAIFFLYALFERDNPVIKSARGKVQFVSHESDTPNEDGTVTSSTSYYVFIGDERFTVKSGQYQFFNQGHIYVIYKEVSVLSSILSIEYIGPPEG